AAALAGIAMASVAVAAASTGAATRAEVQDIRKSPLPIVVMASQVPRPTHLLGYVCDVHARSRRFLGTFRPLAVRHPRLHHLPRRVTASSRGGHLCSHSSRLGESSVTCWHRMATLGTDQLGG